MKIERRPLEPFTQEVEKPIIGRRPNISSDPTWTENRGDGAHESNVNNPMLDTTNLFSCFTRAIKQDVILSDTLARKNPFHPGPNPKGIFDQDLY